MSEKTLLIRNIESLMIKEGLNLVQLSSSCGVPQPTISRILNATSAKPRIETINKIAEFFGYTHKDIMLEDLSANKEALHYIPIIDWGEIYNWLGTRKTNSSQSLPTIRNVSHLSFALNDHQNLQQPYSDASTVLIFDPEREPKDKDFVLVKFQEFPEILYRQIIVDGSEKFIKSINPELNFTGRITKLKEEDRVLAALVQVILNV